MHEIKTCIEIESTPEEVWAILVDFPAHSKWNPFIRSIEGTAKEGERLKVSNRGLHPAALRASHNACVMERQ